MISADIKDVAVHVGDTVRVHTQVIEGTRTRIQIFEGIVISMRGRSVNKTFTVRRISPGGLGVERTWPMEARNIVKVEVKKSGKNVRRAKLYYLRDRIGRQAVRV